MNGLCYIDGLVSTGKKFPYTILKINFALLKNIYVFFINILKSRVDNRIRNCAKIRFCFFKNSLFISFLIPGFSVFKNSHGSSPRKLYL